MFNQPVLAENTTNVTTIYNFTNIVNISQMDICEKYLDKYDICSDDLNDLTRNKDNLQTQFDNLNSKCDNIDELMENSTNCNNNLRNTQVELSGLRTDLINQQQASTNNIIIGIVVGFASKLFWDKYSKKSLPEHEPLEAKNLPR